MLKLIFIVIILFLLLGLFYEIVIEHENKLLRLNELATKKQKIRLIKKAYLTETKKRIRKTLKTNKNEDSKTNK